MTDKWEQVTPIEGYDRTYRNGSFRVAFAAMAPDLKFLPRDLFVGGRADPLQLPPVYVEGQDILSDDCLDRSLRDVIYHIEAMGLEKK